MSFPISTCKIQCGEVGDIYTASCTEAIILYVWASMPTSVNNIEFPQIEECQFLFNTPTNYC